MSEQIKQIISASIETKQRILGNEKMIQILQDCVDLITVAFKNGKFISPDGRKFDR